MHVGVYMYVSVCACVYKDALCKGAYVYMCGVHCVRVLLCLYVYEGGSCVYRVCMCMYVLVCAKVRGQPWLLFCHLGFLRQGLSLGPGALRLG